MLQTLKNIGDTFFGTIWSFSLIRIMPLLGSSGTAVFFPQLDRGLSFAISLLGLAYGIVRIIISVRKAKQDERYREQEIIEKQNSNFGRKWNDEFLKDKK